MHAYYLNRFENKPLSIPLSLSLSLSHIPGINYTLLKPCFLQMWRRTTGDKALEVGEDELTPTERCTEVLTYRQTLDHMQSKNVHEEEEEEKTTTKN